MATSLNLFLADKLSPLVLATQPKLLSVNLTNNLISDVQPGAFANMTRLVRLILTKNKIGKLEEGSLQGGISFWFYKRVTGEPLLSHLLRVF